MCSLLIGRQILLRKALLLLFYVLCLARYAAVAQYDIGFSAGAFGYDLKASNPEGHDVARFDVLSAPSFTCALFYRERSSNRVNFGLSFEFPRRSFHARYISVGLAVVGEAMLMSISTSTLST